MTNVFDVIELPKLRLKDTTPTPVYQSFARVISQHFGNISQNLLNSLDTLQRTRDKLMTSTNPDIVIPAATEYYNYLAMLTQRLQSTTLNVNFTWTDTFKKAPVASQLINYEMACVLYNGAVVHFNSASACFKEDIKAAIDHLKLAASFFAEIGKVTARNDKQITALDLKPESSKAMSQLCLYAAQYLYYSRSKLENRSVPIQLKLGSGLYKLSIIAREALKQVKANMDKSEYAVIVMFIKSTVSEVQLQIADHEAEEELKYGEQITRTQDAIQSFESIAKMKELPKEYRSLFDTTLRDLKAKLAEYVHSNDTVYFQPVPESSLLEYPEATILAKPMSIPVMENNPFKELLPLKIRASYNSYMAKATKVIEDTKRIAPELTQKGNDNIKNMKLQELIEIMNNPDGIPADMAKFAEEYSSTNQFKKINDSIALMEHTTSKNDALMDEIKKRFDAEALKDNDGILKYGNYWKIPLTSNQADKINGIREIETLITTRKRSDVGTISKFRINREMLETLGKGMEALHTLFPGPDEIKMAKDIIVRLETLRGEWEQLVTERDELLQMMLQNADTQEEKLIDELNTSADQVGVVQKYTTRLNELTQEMQNSFNQQKDLFNRIMVEYNELQLSLGTKMVELSTNIDKINSAMNTSRELRDELALSISEHSAIYSKIISLQSSVFNFCDNHAFEAEQLMKQLDSAKAPYTNQSTTYLQTGESSHTAPKKAPPLPPKTSAPPPMQPSQYPQTYSPQSKYQTSPYQPNVYSQQPGVPPVNQTTPPAHRPAAGYPQQSRKSVNAGYPQQRTTSPTTFPQQANNYPGQRAVAPSAYPQQVNGYPPQRAVGYPPATSPGGYPQQRSSSAGYPYAQPVTTGYGYAQNPYARQSAGYPQQPYGYQQHLTQEQFARQMQSQRTAANYAKYGYVQQPTGPTYK